ncbi:transcriptional regulator [Desulfurispira natronophila]|uniref:DNA-binding MarR family transcriptional regulator n=1 Tax=Desulfurispira natronophila TaxID=682562 RepID=A0A7W7Y326_9BACT|nr:transcriptional regulator [Desulfurispira natronophila]MBB5021143.1 DNA-binding MarR family transcriptional regulator [Desulfurispira natronophila]
MFDPLLHSPHRSHIISLLSTHGELSFRQCKDLTGMSDGNLSSHMRHLSVAGYVSLEKAQVGGSRTTIFQLTNLGREAFTTYLRQLKTFVKQHRKLLR